MSIIQANNIRAPHTTFMTMRTNVLGLRRPASLEYTPVQSVQISTTDSNPIIKKIVSMIVSISIAI